MFSNNELNVGILTYQTFHRKTYDVASLLVAMGYKNVTVYATSFKYKKNFCPIYTHRPPMYDFSGIGLEIDNSSVYKNFGYKYLEIDDYNELDNESNDVYLVCGAGILPDSFIKSNRVVNSHPGYIPYVRGLDALKWAIVEKNVVGVTTHFVGDQVDAGEVIQRLKVPVYSNDLFYHLAERQYQYEIVALVKSIELLDGEHEFYEAGDSIQHRRMPFEVEKNLLNEFEDYKKMFCAD